MRAAFSFVCHSSRRSRWRAFTLVEALVLLTIVSIVAVGAGVGLQSSISGPENMNNMLALDRSIATQMDLLKQASISSWSTLSSNAGTSTVTINGKSYTKTITITAQSPPDGSGGTATDFSKITVQIGGQSMVTYVSQP